MRKIAPARGSHNGGGGRAHATAGWLARGLVVLGLVALAACGRDAPGPDASAVHPARGCALVVDDSGLAAFWAAADRLAADPGLSAAEIGARLAALPAWDRWRRAQGVKPLTTEQLGAIARAGVLGRAALAEDEARRVPRPDVARAQAFTLARRAEVDAFVRDWLRDEPACGVRELVAGWVPAAALPDTLRIDLLAGGAEIRAFEGRLLVDAGVALACGPRQLNRLLASVIYRDVAAAPGPSPLEVAGPDALGHTVRILRNEGVAAVIDDLPHVFFGREHPLLAGTAPVPEELCATARRNLLQIEQVVAQQLARPAAARAYDDVVLGLGGSRGWQATGWFMAHLVRERLGEARLRDAAPSLAAFVAAYQEAAAANPARPDAAPGTVAHFVATAPVFSPAVAATLREAAAAVDPAAGRVTRPGSA